MSATDLSQGPVLNQPKMVCKQLLCVFVGHILRVCERIAKKMHHRAWICTSLGCFRLLNKWQYLPSSTEVACSFIVNVILPSHTSTMENVGGID